MLDEQKILLNRLFSVLTMLEEQKIIFSYFRVISDNNNHGNIYIYII
jgi:hypothetical protein